MHLMHTAKQKKITAIKNLLKKRNAVIKEFAETGKCQTILNNIYQ